MSNLDRVKELLLMLSELPASERRAALAGEVGEGSELFHEVLSLAEADDDLGQDLMTPLRVGERTKPTEVRRIGPYQIDTVLGRGGMSIVYRGLQETPVRRQVAVKMLREEATTPELIERFDVERRALARLQHTNIAHVLDAGVDTHGVPYLAMELVDGPTITQF